MAVNRWNLVIKPRLNLKSKKTAFVNYVDQSFIAVFSLTVMAGRNFSEDQPSSEVMVNESLVKALGFVRMLRKQ